MHQTVNELQNPTPIAEHATTPLYGVRAGLLAACFGGPCAIACGPLAPIRSGLGGA